jgi:hypothetical protein
MPLPAAATFAADLSTELAALDPDGFGSLSAEDQARIEAKLFTAIATVTLAAIAGATVTVAGTTACSTGPGTFAQVSGSLS